MNALKDKKIILTIVGTLVIALILYFVGISTLNSKISANNSKKATLETNISSLQAQIVAEKAAVNNKGFIISKLTQFQQAVPQTVNLGSVTNQLNSLCQAANINWQGDTVGTPSTPSTSGGGSSTASSLIQIVPLTFSVTGAWSAIENSFIPGLYRAPAQPPQQVSRLVVITGYSINLGEMKGTNFVQSGTVSIAFTANIYIAPTITPVSG